MKIQSLAVIFIIIILPISLILTSYTQNQIKTLDLQILYDTRLNDATHDALLAFQLNTVNSDTSDLANSKLRDISASVNSFFNSVSTNFNMSGYNKDILKDYVPALVYTMYDGYYIYSPYVNTLDASNENEIVNYDTGETEVLSDAEILNSENENATYHDGEKLSGLKPYIYYSCRYKYNGSDFVITYSLDNYITIQGMINVDGRLQWVYDYGYLLDNIEETQTGVKYRGIPIENEIMQTEYAYDAEKELEDGQEDKEKIQQYDYIKINGVKYYKEEVEENEWSGEATNKVRWFSVLNNKKYPQDTFNPQVSTAVQYYKDAKAFKDRILNKYKLGNLNSNMAVDEEGNLLYEEIEDKDGNIIKTSNPKFGNNIIFDFGNQADGSIEDPDSTFNEQRLAVIRYCIEKELSIAIANYNNYSTIYTNFQMPKLDEAEWDKIVNNVSIISFLQGLSIGGKIYNGYSIITNNKNEEFVPEDSIYIITNDNEYHRPDDKALVGNSNIVSGVLNIDLEIKTVTQTEGGNLYFIPKGGSLGSEIIGSYTSIVNVSNVAAPSNYYEYIANAGGTLATKYFTALGRERYGQYRTNSNPDELKLLFGVGGNG